MCDRDEGVRGVGHARSGRTEGSGDTLDEVGGRVDHELGHGGCDESDEGCDGSEGLHGGVVEWW